MKQSSILATVAIVALTAVASVPTLAASHAAEVTSVPVQSSPPVPAGLKVTCMINGTDLQSATACPVVRYRGITTWAYSFIDNRVALALVSYDVKNNVVRNVTLDGTRYVWQIALAPGAGTVTFTGQSNQSVVANLENLGAP